MPKKCQDQIHVGKKPLQNQATGSKENVQRKNLVLVDIFSNQVGTSLSGGHNLPKALNNKKVKTQFLPSDSSDIEFDTESNQRNCIRGGLQNEFKFSGRGGVKRLHLKNNSKIDQSKFMREKSNNQPRRISNTLNKFANTRNKFAMGGKSLSEGHNLPTALNNKKVKKQFIPSDSNDIEFDTESNQQNCIRGGLQNEFKFSGRGGVKRLHLQNKGKIDQSKFMKEKNNNKPRRMTNTSNKFANTRNKFANTKNKFMGGKSNKLPKKTISAQSGPQDNFMREKSNNLSRSITNEPTKDNNQLQGHYGETSDVGDDEIPDFENESEGNIFYR